MLVSMLPIIELQGRHPLRRGPGTESLGGLCGQCGGQSAPAPFPSWSISGGSLQWMRRRVRWLNALVDKMEKRPTLKGRRCPVQISGSVDDLCGHSCRGPGGWTNALAAAFLEHALRKAYPP